ncbi:hypothetical protein [Thioclava nitratireducens]|uniref:hypothetical protein n=1 Tax=Thioclava nitratireducens TaxID=1915078 RepID=UPI0024816E52|nr:hypothetical protein [Thioclava nitratireducens]WGT51714.1 hypothetical protein P0N61_06730 [Thioclava nitratireducens]
MSASAEAIAFLLEEQDLRHLFQQWPQHMCLAVGLDPEGGCAMLVFHASEAERVLPRLARSMNWRADEFSVIPKIDGYQTRRMLFSDEQKILSLVQDTDNLPEIARDYAINFAYAADEGLDPEALTDAKSASVSPALREVERLLSALNPTHSATPSAPPTSRNAASVPTDRAETTAPVSADGGPPGFRRLSDTHRAEALMATCELSLDADTVRITIDEAGADAQSFGVRDVYFRDDLRSFAIPVEELARQGATALPGQIHAATDHFPAPLLATLRQAPLTARLTALDHYIFIAPEAAKPRAAALSAPARAEPGKFPAKREGAKPQMRTMLGGAALIFFSALALQLGLTPALSHGEARKVSLDTIRESVFQSLADEQSGKER